MTISTSVTNVQNMKIFCVITVRNDSHPKLGKTVNLCALFVL